MTTDMYVIENNSSPTELPQDPQNRELMILNSVLEIISSTNRLSETLEQALGFVLSTVNADVGWVCLHNSDGGCYSFVGQQGLCFSNTTGKPTPCLVNCVCDRVRRTKEVVIINRLSPGCPLVKVAGEPDRKITGHVSIPMMTKSRLVGQLNIAFTHAGKIPPADIDLLRRIAPPLAVAIENALLWEELQNKEQMLKKLLINVVTAQEEERRRISRELHDEMGQNLSSLLIGLSLLEKSSECSGRENLLGSMTTTVSGMISSIHDLALELRPTALDDLGLISALTQYISECPTRLGIQVDYEIIGSSEKRLSREAEIMVYRIVQESLTNVARHAKASKASILLNKGEKSLTIIIEDNGVGFDLQEVRLRNKKMKRLGLYGMEERAALVGGVLTIESTPGNGTSIYVEIPWEVEPHD